MCVCARACMRACVRACVRECVHNIPFHLIIHKILFRYQPLGPRRVATILPSARYDEATAPALVHSSGCSLKANLLYAGVRSECKATVFGCRRPLSVCQGALGQEQIGRLGIGILRSWIGYGFGRWYAAEVNGVCACVCGEVDGKIEGLKDTEIDSSIYIHTDIRVCACAPAVCGCADTQVTGHTSTQDTQVIHMVTRAWSRRADHVTKLLTNALRARRRRCTYVHMST